VHYLEVYGGKVTAASKQYTGERAVGFGLSDSGICPERTSPPLPMRTG
jgi:hypothetical protein